MNGTTKTVTLDDLCDLVNVQVAPEMHENVTYIGLEHVAPGNFFRVGQGTASDVQSSKFVFKTGDVLYGKLRPYLDKAILADIDGICTTELLVLRPKQGVDPRFLLSVVHAPNFIDHAMSGVTGVQHPRTSWHRIKEFELADFDLAEQKNIANLLFLIQKSMRSCEHLIESGDELKRTTMQELFTRGLRGEKQKETEIGLVPESWDVEQIRRHYDVASGGTPSRTVPAYWVGGTIPWVKTTEVGYCTILDTEEKITPEGLKNSAAKMFPVGTLLMAMYGQGVTRGKVAILGIDAACNQACAAMNPRDNDINPKYLFHFLTYRYEDIRQLAHGGQQQNLNLDIVRDLLISFPTNNKEQQEIVEILDAIDQKIDLHKRKRAVLEELFKSLLHKLMTGEIRVADLDLSALDIQEKERAMA